jgi:hypothetical protein
MAKQPSFKPEEHFRSLKGQQYLEVKCAPRKAA